MPKGDFNKVTKNTSGWPHALLILSFTLLIVFKRLNSNSKFLIPSFPINGLVFFREV